MAKKTPTRIKTSKELKEAVKKLSKPKVKHPTKAPKNSGGARKGAGRKKGDVQLIKKQLREILIAELGPEKILKLFDKVYDLAIHGDKDMLKYIIDQLYGRPTDRIHLQGSIENNINVQINDAKSTLQAKIIKVQKAKEIEADIIDDKH